MSGSDDGISESSGDEYGQRDRHQATVYDAAAGRITARKKRPRDGKDGEVKSSTRSAALGPDEVLFRRRGAPERYAEHDIYYANERRLGRGGRGGLPDSDLLKAVHSYASKFYAMRRRSSSHPGGGGGGVVAGHVADEGSMDETALLAFGILLEEESRHILGRKGDLVFTEADITDEDDDDDDDDDDDHGGNDGREAQEVGAGVTTRKRRRLLAPGVEEVIDSQHR